MDRFFIIFIDNKPSKNNALPYSLRSTVHSIYNYPFGNMSQLNYNEQQLNFTDQETFLMPTLMLFTPVSNKILNEKNNYLM
jgi:hypothetical protein